jgi:hypothetical protein
MNFRPFILYFNGSQPFGPRGTLWIFIFFDTLELEYKTRIYKKTPILSSVIYCIKIQNYRETKMKFN